MNGLEKKVEELVERAIDHGVFAVGRYSDDLNLVRSRMDLNASKKDLLEHIAREYRPRIPSHHHGGGE